MTILFTLPYNLFVHTAELTSSFVKLLDVHGDFSRSFVEQKKKQLAELQQEHAALNATNEQLKSRAFGRADNIIKLGLAYLIAQVRVFLLMMVANLVSSILQSTLKHIRTHSYAQGAFVARLTWWELSWDIMEPVTYMITFGTCVGGMLCTPLLLHFDPS